MVRCPSNDFNVRYFVWLNVARKIASILVEESVRLCECDDDKFNER